MLAKCKDCKTHWNISIKKSHEKLKRYVCPYCEKKRIDYGGTEMSEILIGENIENEEFVIDSDYKAEWAIRQIKENTEKAKEKIDKHKLDLDFYKNYYKNEIESEERELEYANQSLIHMLDEYFKTVESNETKTQHSYKLPSGRLILKKEQEVILRDDEYLLNLFKDTNQSEFIQTRETTKWGEYKKKLSIVDGKVITDDGEIIDLKIEKRPAVFEVRV